MARLRSSVTKAGTPAVFSAMRTLGATTSADLIEICRNSKRDTADRAQACLLVGLLRSRASVDDLLDVAERAEEPLLIWQAFAAVGAIMSRRATRSLVGIIRSTNLAIRRQAAVFALGLLHDERGRSVLIRTVLDQKEDPKTRGIAAEALGLLRSRPDTSRVLAAMLGDPSAEVSYAALCTLAALRDRSAVGAIEQLLDDQSVADGGGSIGDQAARVLQLMR